MKAKSLLQIIPALMISVAIATTSIAAEKVKPEAVSKGMLTALNNQVGLVVPPKKRTRKFADFLALLVKDSGTLSPNPWDFSH
jgi:hypothetical protein